MIEAVEFHNFKALRDTSLPLGRFTLIIGPNGSGKSTALRGLQAVHSPEGVKWQEIVSAALRQDPEAAVRVIVHWADGQALVSQATWLSSRVSGPTHFQTNGGDVQRQPQQHLQHFTSILRRVSIYALNPNAIAAPSQLQPKSVFRHDGGELAGVLDALRDRAPERFEMFNAELARWMPEFDRVLFSTPAPGRRAFALRSAIGQHEIEASQLSDGTLISLALLSLVYLPDPPPVICLEEPDRGIHPRLLREVQDAIYRLAFPENHDEQRAPVQVIATTHSPYFLDLFKDHPEEIVIAEKAGSDVQFKKLSDHPHIEDILEGAALGDVWYTGILGGVPAGQ